MEQFKNWKSRKIVISSSHIAFLKELAEQTGFNSLSEVVNHALGDYRLLKNTNTNNNTNTNATASNVSNTTDTSSDDDDFGLDEFLL